MDFNKLIIVTYIFFMIIVLTQIQNTTSQEVEDEKEFSYIEGTENGPENWGFIHQEWEICNTGQNQSPIDLSDRKVVISRELGPLRRTYRTSIATMVNRGHDIMLRWDINGAGGFWINGKEYILRQLHWHSPSEHTLNNERFALELHMVHVSTDGEIAVIGILYRLGLPDLFLLTMERYIKAVGNRPDGREFVGLVNPRLVELGSIFYYRYSGSLTTPACNEGVIWTVLSRVRTVSRGQVELLREAVHDGMESNARPLQDDNGRTVKYFGPRRRI